MKDLVKIKLLAIMHILIHSSNHNRVKLMVFNATVNKKYISVISRKSVLLVEETDDVVSSTARHERDSNSQL
jgi:hypothetical protein